MFKWNKLGKVFDPTETKDRPWLKEFAQAPATLIFDDFVRVYFSCRPPRNESGQYVSYTGYLDLNRNNLFDIINIAKQPIMPLGKPGTFDEFGTYPASVINYNNELIAYYGGWTRCESVPFNVAIGMAKSKDNGVTFDKMGDGPVLSYTVGEPFVLSGPKIRRFNDRWYLWYIAGKKWLVTEGGQSQFYKAEPVYRIRMAVSNDGINWERVGRDIIEPKLEENEAQASPDVIFHNGKYHMFYCYRHSQDYRENSRGYRIGYAWSDNIVDWHRDDSKAGIDVSKEGWDSESIAYPHVFKLDGKVYMLYLGNQVGRFGFGVAELEGDLA